MNRLADAHAVIRRYSTTWYEPVVALPPRLNEAASCAYLLMRGIDEIEDHPQLDAGAKAALLRQVARILQTRYVPHDFRAAFDGRESVLPDVTLRLAEWVFLAPPDIAPRVVDTFSTMAARMADWVERDWRIRAARDLDEYTYAVAGTLVLLLSDLWSWFDGTRSDRTCGIAYGRALQAANILADRREDATRGVDFWPHDWTLAHMLDYVDAEFAGANRYVDMLPPASPARAFCEAPLRRARAAVERLHAPAPA